MGITYLRDPQKAADEIRRNAARGFVAVSLPEQPYMAGLPSIHDHDYWAPVLQACVDTDTVICLHIGSSGQLMGRDPAAPPGVGSGATLFQVQSVGVMLRMALGRRAAALPDDQDRDVRRGHRLGADGHGPPRLHDVAVGPRTNHVATDGRQRIAL
jgi:hypothetical protein